MGGSESSIISEASQETQNDLKCNICKEFLTWFPIILHPEKGNICGRCSIIKGGIRNKGLEALIKLHKVPCRYSENGCKELLQFNNNDDNIRKHELNCNHRSFYCPSISLRNNCNWNGKRINIQQHYKDNHKDLIFNSNKILTIDLSLNMTQNIMVDSLDKIFFLYMKYEKLTQKIYCGLIALYEPSAPENDYEFTINLKEGTQTYSFKRINWRMAENFLIDNKYLFEINLNKISLLITDSKHIEYSVTINEIKKNT